LTFKELNISDQLLSGLDAMGFEKATPIQEQAIPLILDGKDLIACAQTGTGKTAAFLLPIIDQLMGNDTKSVDALILVPTRELAVQIDQQLEGFAYFTDISSIPIYGGRDGNSFDDEKRALKMGANIVVATPGRLIAHLNMGYVKIDQLKHLILDEADRMLDMGFQNDIMKIINYLPKERQTLMFSATMPPKIRQFSKRILIKPEQISLAISKPAAGILQGAYYAEDNQKPHLIVHLLKKRKGVNERILIFSSTKANVKNIVSALKSGGLGAGEIHSDLDQKAREEMLRSFKNGSQPILVATDILSRGIDVKGIDLVVNYDVPGDAEDYIHRIGRTARADSEGVALTFINRKDRRKFSSIEYLMEQEVKKVNLPPEIPKAQAPEPSRGRSNSRNYRSGGGRGGNKNRRSNKPKRR
jgi:superfamily II DNA/RNA helicase